MSCDLAYFLECASKLGLHKALLEAGSSRQWGAGEGCGQ